MSFQKFKETLKAGSPNSGPCLEAEEKQALQVLQGDMQRGRWELHKQEGGNLQLFFRFHTWVHADPGTVEAILKKEMNQSGPCNPKMHTIVFANSLVQQVTVSVVVSQDIVWAPENLDSKREADVLDWLTLLGGNMRNTWDLGPYQYFLCEIDQVDDKTPDQVLSFIQQSAQKNGIWVGESGFRHLGVRYQFTACVRKA